MLRPVPGAKQRNVSVPQNAGPEWQARILGWRSRELVGPVHSRGLLCSDLSVYSKPKLSNSKFFKEDSISHFCIPEDFVPTNYLYVKVYILEPIEPS